MLGYEIPIFVRLEDVNNLVKQVLIVMSPIVFICQLSTWDGTSLTLKWTKVSKIHC